MVQPGRPQMLRRYLPMALLLSLLAIVGISAGVAFAGASVSVINEVKPVGRSAPMVTASSTVSSCAPAWQLVDSPNPNNQQQLLGISASSPTDTWAVGYSSGITDEITLIEHWDGLAWNVVPSPNVTGVVENQLRGVSVISANDVWAVGLYTTYTPNTQRTLAEHWDGTQWSIVQTPNVNSNSNYLTAVSTLATNDVWAVGYYLDESNFELTLSMHWDGTAWTIVTTPNPQPLGYAHFWAVSALSTDDVWAVGEAGLEGGLVEHWNGTQWDIATIQNIGAYETWLGAVDAVAPDNVWVAGNYQSFSESQPGQIIQRNLVLHWDGATWQQVTTPNPGASENSLYDIEVLGDGWWAVGDYRTSVFHTSVIHNGEVVPSVDPGTGDNSFRALTAANNHLWAAGFTGSLGAPNTLIEDYTECEGSATPTLTPDLSTATTTGTPTPTFTFSPTPTPTATRTLVCQVGWNIVPGPDGGQGTLWGVAAISSDDVWADGINADLSTTLMEHWNGSAWGIIPSPNPGTFEDLLYGIAAASANDIWAVGEYSNDGSYHYPLIEHWDGSVWNVVSSGTGNDTWTLNAVAARTASDAWAVGWDAISGSIILHWDGSSWGPVTAPSQGILNGVTAISANDAWAVGIGGNNQTLTEHWDGSAWTVVSSPDPGDFNFLRATSAISSNDVWAVGYSLTDILGEQTLMLHWDGTAWTQVPSPTPDGQGLDVLGVSARATNDVWAVGFWDGNSGRNPFAEHWDGSQWTISPDADPGYGGALHSVSTLAANDVWAAGTLGPALTERYANPCLTTTPTQTPTYTQTPAVSPTRTTTVTTVTTATVTWTATSTQPAVTATSTTTVTATSTTTPRPISTPTACPIQFTDVPSGSTFYPYVRCLACLGIINGYANGTFKPNNNVTRGQLSKIVSNAAGFSDTQPTQMFQDVPAGSTFQVYIGRLASRGYINGYTCGGAGEPCVPPDNLPYFRPNNNATRGQISKIDANAAGYSDPPSGQQFEDVPVGSTYYTYTYRLVSRGVMGGYPCGGVGEPCVPPRNLPYFRPNNNATRGQTSKIVANTFFPDCQTPER